MVKPSPWTSKILALLHTGNTRAVIAQIKIAPSIKDLKTLQTSLLTKGLLGRRRDMDEAVIDNLALLSPSRLRRSP
ncbi:hypothetical protein FVQ98_07485 [Ottowia sp. GY511]|uniref:Uncharacterized protein n=1 Tax=Ottowia flava TaxID=2675430 RepID=A0ABW4KMX3_9BURK|nr:hypothetical protein [Ottowia sp. GY511]TXK29726.1 hypothetical protein FVQ98_07485 [Ottowia sp. GY511]